MTSVSEVTGWLEQFAPSVLAEPWDNVGLLWGDPAAPVERIMTCLTVTPVTAAEAVGERASLIVSHHPVLFREVKKIRADLVETSHLWRLASAGIAIASPHTAFDNTRHGINDLLCQRLGLVDISPLRLLASQSGETGKDPAAPGTFKVVVFAPDSDREAVLSGAFQAGAGQIGAYRECSFAIPGQGTFFGTEAANPAVGQRGRRETVPEFRLEIVCPAVQLDAVLAAIRAGHSYEEPAIDVYPLHQPGPARDRPDRPGSGRIGRFAESCTLAEFASRASRILGSAAVQMVGDPHRQVLRVAVACGAGDDFLKDAAHAGADVLLTGEARFHRGVEAEALGVGLVAAGHYATERLGVEDLSLRIAAAFPGLTVWPSRVEQDPFRFIAPEAGNNL
jgi:dinuclear metal center YbgI/SA1388 family protein